MTRDHRVWRLVTAALGACAGAAAGLRDAASVPWLVVVAFAWLLPSLWLGPARGRRAGKAVQVVALGVVAMAVAGVSGERHAGLLRAGPVAALAAAGAVTAAELRVTRDPVAVTTANGAQMWLVDAAVDSVGSGASAQPGNGRPVLVFAFGRAWSVLVPGQRLTVFVRWQRPRPGDSVAAVVDARTPPTLEGRPPWWQRWAQQVRSRLAAACGGLPADEQALVPALVLGVVRPMPATLKEQFQVTGLSHLVAVSGENLAILFAACLWLLRWLGLGRRLRALLLLLVVVAFVVVARPSASVLRAAVMGGVTVVALMSGRRHRPLPALALAVTLLVVVDPWLVDDLGFGLSVSATAGLVLLAPGMVRRLNRWLPRVLSYAVAVPLAAQLACTPLLLVTFRQLTPYAVPANLAAGLAVPAATLAGIAVAAVAVAWPGAAGWLAHLAALPAAWIIAIARRGAGLPGAATVVGPGVGMVAALGAAVVVAGLLALEARRHRGVVPA